ncbi:MAG: hypothetical protein KAR42_17020 [candidate division Zixibacteria bacterium]|nr:hypothetical protein [candidate division Zixibacteria bacterium]
MSYSKYERGKEIKSNMNLSILMALGREEIDAAEASRIFGLISDVGTAGTTHSRELVKEPFYLQALKSWQAALERRSRDRLVPKLRRLLRFVLNQKMEEKHGTR